MTAELFDSPLSDMIRCVRREIKMREKTYPRWVATKRMSKESVLYELSTMRAILNKLETEDKLPATLRERDAEIENLRADADNDAGLIQSLKWSIDEMCAVIGIERGHDQWPEFIERMEQVLRERDAEIKRLREGLETIAGAIEGCLDAPKNPDSLPQMVLYEARRLLAYRIPEPKL